HISIPRSDAVPRLYFPAPLPPPWFPPPEPPRVALPDRRRAAAERHVRPVEGRAARVEVWKRNYNRRHREWPPDRGRRQAAGARATHAAAGLRGVAQRGSERGQRNPLHRSAIAAAVQRLSGVDLGGAVEG